MSTSSNPLLATPGIVPNLSGNTFQDAESLGTQPKKQGFFGKLGSVVANHMGEIQESLAHLAAIGGNYQPLESLRQQRQDALQQQMLNSTLADQSQSRQLRQLQIDNFQTPDQASAAALKQATALEDMRTLHGPSREINTDSGDIYEDAYDPATNQRVTRPKMGMVPVPNPELEPYRQAAAGNPPNLVMDWNAGPPPTMPATVTQQKQLKAPPKFDPNKEPRNIPTSEDLKNRIAVAYEQGDKATVAKLQSELKAIDPFGAERLADVNQRLADAQAKNEQAQRQFQPAIAGSVVQAAATQDSVRRLMGILQPYSGDNQPFGNFLKQAEYRLGKGQSDAIGQELAGINLASLQQAASVLKSMGGVRSVQALQLALQHTPDPTKDSTMLMYQKMGNIDRALSTFLKEANQYGRKGATDIEPWRMAPYGEAPVMPGTPNGPSTLPKVPPQTADAYLRSIGVQ